MPTYEVNFERTVNRTSSVEGSVPLSAETEAAAEAEFFDAVPSDPDEWSASVEAADESSPAESATPLAFERVVYREIVVEGKAPVEADSADEAEETFLTQVADRTTRTDAGDATPAFEVEDVARWRS